MGDNLSYTAQQSERKENSIANIKMEGLHAGREFGALINVFNPFTYFPSTTNGARFPGDRLSMTSSKRVARGVLQLTVGYAGQQGALFARNVVIANAIGVEQFGIAVTLSLVWSAIEAASDVGIDFYMIRVSAAGGAYVQGTLHSIALLRGMLIAVIMFAAALPFSTIFNTSQALWAYQVLAVAPLLRGFRHLDIQRFQSELRYGPATWSAFCGGVAGLLVGLAIALGDGGYAAMLWAIITDAAITTLCSHLFAQQVYNVAFSASAARPMFKFGMPLLANAIVLYIANQGDRFIIGVSFGVYDLAKYAAAITLLAGPSLLFLKVSGSIALPLLAKASGISEYKRRYALCGAGAAIAASVWLVLFSLYGAKLVVAFYGSEYSLPAEVIVWMAIGSAAKILRSWPQAASIAAGRTAEVLNTSLVRCIGSLGIIAAVAIGSGVVGVAISVAVGEALALGYAVWRSDRFQGQQLNAGRALVALYLVLSAGTVLLAKVLGETMGGAHSVGLLVVALIVSFVGVLAVTPEMRLWLNGVSVRLRRSLGRQ